ncbi:putative Bicyclomycin resistance protein [Seiridium unicorne]|uniref:Bicyclomycin resistance protein n=1 Tax=Seiridium unicorne TaxID=138068 RepID=A0ABR2UGH3_9PEZI
MSEFPNYGNGVQPGFSCTPRCVNNSRYSFQQVPRSSAANSPAKAIPQWIEPAAGAKVEIRGAKLKNSSELTSAITNAYCWLLLYHVAEESYIRYPAYLVFLLQSPPAAGVMASNEPQIADAHESHEPPEQRLSLQAAVEDRDADRSLNEKSLQSTEATYEKPATPTGTTGSEDRDVEKQAGAEGVIVASAEDTDNDDPNIVRWDDDDPEHPFNWPRWRTLTNLFLISFMTFLTPLASSIFAPGVPQLMEEFQSDSLELAAFVVSVYILGFAFGPLIIAPMSEIYGRVIMYHVCNVCFIAFLVACGLAPSLNSLIVFRFFSGVFGACPVTNGGGSIADMVPQERRAAAMAGYTIGPLLGPIIGPIAGGFLAEAMGWRWDFWLLAIVAGALSLVMLVTMKETYHPLLLQRKTERLRKETGNQLLRSQLDNGLSPRDYFKRGIIRPMKMIVKSPIIIILSVFVAIAYGYLYLMFTSMTIVFEEYYGFSTSLVGLSFIGLGVGSLAGVGFFSTTSDRYMKKKAAEADALAESTGAAKEGMKPEYRLPLFPYGALMLPVGLFLYGWTAEYRVHWIVPIIGTAIVGMGNLVIFMSLQLYLIDAFTAYAASAMAANTVVRSIAGGVLPLAGLRMYERLGVGWGNSLLGFIALLLVPAAFAIIKYGEQIRKRFEIKNL